ncbi:MAG: carboxypeptidase regulatory-like domain-containing protein, partial [Verrucomicrobia bacterium]|nr:carboxypeptidase regulatory-like domain-containing protein [Verrucomicrobiota bacterium]
MILLCGLAWRSQAQTAESLSSSISAIDRLLAVTTTNQAAVSIGDMQLRTDKLAVWRDILQVRLDRLTQAGMVVPKGSFDFSFGSAWPGGVVPYTYQTAGTNAMPTNKIILFEQAIRLWQDIASINFKPRTAEANYLLIKYTGNGDDAAMNSYVGMQGGAQELNVAGWGNLVDCAHELGHALGMSHEHQRPDRDTYVTVNLTNLATNANPAVNFAIVPGAIVRTAYDFDSLMHYGRSAFAKSPGLLTISVNPPSQRWSDGAAPEEIGQKTHISTLDKAAMAAQYNAPLSISGNVAAAGGAPLAGVQVYLEPAAAVYRGQNPVTTDASGNYIITGLPRNSGSYTVRAVQLSTTFLVPTLTVAATTFDWSGINFAATDTAPPDLLITEPTVSGIYTNITTTFGTATVDAGVKEVRVALARTADLVWWNWVDGVWGTTTFDWAKNAKIATGTTNWSTALPGFADGGYQLHVQSVDLADNASPWKLRHFFVDPTPPSVGIQLPAHNGSTVNFFSLRGTATDGGGSGISSNTVYFTVYQDGDFWTGFNWKSGTTAQDPEVLLKADVVSGEWSYTQLPEAPDNRTGIYAVSTFVKDVAGNTSQPQPGVTSAIFTVDRTEPSVAITSPATGSSMTSLPSGNWFTGTLSDNIGVAYVNLFIRRERDGLYWNGSGWSVLSTPASIITSSTNGGTWQNSSTLPVPGSTLENGAYAFIAVAVDTAGNQRQVDSSVTLDYHPVFLWTAGSYSDGINGNENQNWENPANWSPVGVPDSQSVAIINGGQPYAGAAGPISLYQLNLNGGVLYNASLTVGSNSTFNWLGGQFDSGPVNILPDGVVVISNVYMVASVITNRGLVVLTNNGFLAASYGSRIENQGIFESTGDAAFYFNGYGSAPVFNNYAGGTLRQGGSTNGTRFLGDNGGWVLNNAGLLDAQAGVLSLEQGSKNLLHGGSITGGYRVRSLGGTLTVAGTNTLGAGATLELASGALTGTGTLAGTGTFEWTGGTIVGASLTVGAAAQLALNNGADRSVD